MSDTSNYEHVANLSDFDNNDRMLIDILGLEIGLFKSKNGYFALSNYCVHQGGPMCEGMISGALDADENFDIVYTKKGGVVSCPWHGWEFDIETGEHLAQTGNRVRTFEVKIVDDRIYLKV